MVDPVGTRSQARVPRDCWSTPRYIGHGPEAPGKAGPPRTLGPGPVSPGTAVQPRVPSGQWPSRRRQLVDPAGSRTQTRVFQGAVQHRGPSDQGPSHTRQLVDLSGSQTRTRGPRNYWSTSLGLGYSPQLPRRNGLPHGPSDTGPSRHGRLVNNTVHLTRVRVARVSWSRHGTSGSRPRRPGSLDERGPKDPGPSPLGPR